MKAKPEILIAACLVLMISSLGRAELVGLWRFDADVSPQPDASGNNHDAEPMNDVTWVNDSERGGVMEFDGDADYLEVEDTDLLSIEGDMTVAAWVNINSFDNWNSILSKTGDVETNKPAPYDFYTIQGGDGRVRTYLGDGAGSLGFSDSFEAPELEAWSHLAITITEDGEVFQYLNGEENGDGFVDAFRVDTDTNLYIGSRADFVTNMWGRMDDVAIFNEVLSVEQIQTILTGDFSEFIGGGLRGDFNNDGAIDVIDIDALTSTILSGGSNTEMDLNGDGTLNNLDREVWVQDVKNSWFGDSNLDGEFNSADFVVVFTRGEYEDSVPGNSTWADGDWNGDGDFSSSDFVAAFSGGGFEVGPRPAVSSVPEPTSGLLFAIGCLATLGVIRRRGV